MPAQGGTQTKRLWTYGKWDTAPALRMEDGLRDMDGKVIDLTDASKVLFSMGWSSSNHIIMPGQSIIDRGEGTIEDAVTGVVEYQWLEDDLKQEGNFDFQWEIVWNDGTVQTTKSLSYDFIRVQSPPFASRKAYTP